VRRTIPDADHLRIATLAAAGFLFFALAVPREAPCTVGEQRARLPPPAECKDPIIGLWKSHRYSEYQRQWTEFSLAIRRVPGTTEDLQGVIYNHSWKGDPSQVQPGPCLGNRRIKVSMDARGFVREQYLEFWGVGRWRLDQVLCGSVDFDYLLDHFSGTIEPDLQEFQSVNNDGGNAVNEPTVFRRIRCYDDGPGPPADMKPPPFQPPSRGCR
jgi:hypothetical protein